MKEADWESLRCRPFRRSLDDDKIENDTADVAPNISSSDGAGKNDATNRTAKNSLSSQPPAVLKSVAFSSEPSASKSASLDSKFLGEKSVSRSTVVSSTSDDNELTIFPNMVTHRTFKNFTNRQNNEERKWQPPVEVRRSVKEIIDRKEFSVKGADLADDDSISQSTDSDLLSVGKDVFCSRKRDDLPGKVSHDTNDDESSNSDDDDDYDESLGYEYPTKLPWHRNAIDFVQTLRYYCGTAINRSDVQLVLVVLIGVNAIMMGLATCPFVVKEPNISAAFAMVDMVFLTIFTVELFLQFIYLGWKLFLDGWLLFDAVIIATSWASDENGLQVIRTFRIFRSLRLITRVRVMKNLVTALFGVMPRMFSIFMLLFLMNYVFAVMFTLLFSDLYAKGATDFDYFSHLSDSFFTLFQMMTLDNWTDVTRQLMAVYSWAWLPCVTYVVLTAFIVVNLMVAVICDAISAQTDEERAMLHGNYRDAFYDGIEDSVTEKSEKSEVNPAFQEDIRTQLDAMEEHVSEMSASQAQLLVSMHLLVRRVQENRLVIQKILEAKSKANKGI